MSYLFRLLIRELAQFKSVDGVLNNKGAVGPAVHLELVLAPAIKTEAQLSSESPVSFKLKQRNQLLCNNLSS
jgi:hypothetical protein